MAESKSKKPRRRSNKGKIRRASKNKRRILKFFRNERVHDVLDFLLMLGIIYFLFTGLMTLILRTDSYWMGVTSQSMKHFDDNSWRLYFTERGIDSYTFPLQGGFERGDLVIVQGVGSFSEIKVGDVVILDQGKDVIPLVHRVIQIWKEGGSYYFTTKGDANASSLPTEVSNSPEQIIGKVVMTIPKLGYISLFFQGA